ncbi:hypothetical protein G4B88_003710 [Cannabis sativa]|uniref:Myb-like domain-containing protein n=1 Tax=Cannabis sativa TaxID=3483 RepID=A0A7J6FA02_CANSA|nr:hypothetical protein G4B88_003710 [Cannabis sativa]
MATATTTPPPPTPGKKPQPIPWTHQETVHLIQAYEEKWYSLKRGPLKSSQWEEVAVTVAARCGYDYTEPSKTAIQCRHKMEKLRQRYRSEKNRVNLVGLSVWPYFDLMDRLERGPLPISAQPMIAIPYRRDRDLDDEDEDDDDDDDEESVIRTKSRSIDYILKRPAIVNRAFSERIVGMESMKMEMMKDTERCRREMETKRIEMIHRSHNKILDSITKAFRF